MKINLGKHCAYIEKNIGEHHFMGERSFQIYKMTERHLLRSNIPEYFSHAKNQPITPMLYSHIHELQHHFWHGIYKYALLKGKKAMIRFSGIISALY